MSGDATTTTTKCICQQPLPPGKTATAQRNVSAPSVCDEREPAPLLRVLTRCGWTCWAARRENRRRHDRLDRGRNHCTDGRA